MRLVSALFVRADGPYPRMLNDWWDKKRDATKYDGKNSVVLHPPCKRWGRFWSSDGSTEPGNDGGLVASALKTVMRVGGVLEHPEGSHAWRTFGLPRPDWSAKWHGEKNVWSTCVPQRNYGHRAIKRTWLLYVGRNPPPELDWSKPAKSTVYLSQPGRCSKAAPRPTCPCKRCEELYGAEWRGEHNRVNVTRLSHRQNEITPDPFARLLILMAQNCGGA